MSTHGSPLRPAQTPPRTPPHLPAHSFPSHPSFGAHHPYSPQRHSPLITSYDPAKLPSSRDAPLLPVRRMSPYDPPSPVLGPQGAHTIHTSPQVDRPGPGKLTSLSYSHPTPEKYPIDLRKASMPLPHRASIVERSRRPSVGFAPPPQAPRHDLSHPHGGMSDMELHLRGAGLPPGVRPTNVRRLSQASVPTRGSLGSPSSIVSVPQQEAKILEDGTGRRRPSMHIDLPPRPHPVEVVQLHSPSSPRVHSQVPLVSAMKGGRKASMSSLAGWKPSPTGYNSPGATGRAPYPSPTPASTPGRHSCPFAAHSTAAPALVSTPPPVASNGLPITADSPVFIDPFAAHRALQERTMQPPLEHFESRPYEDRETPVEAPARGTAGSGYTLNKGRMPTPWLREGEEGGEGEWLRPGEVDRALQEMSLS